MRVRIGEDKMTVCSACGAEAVRGSAKYCLICGKLMREDYQPLDSIRSSYGLQQKHLEFGEAAAKKSEDLFPECKNPTADMAWACVVYSSVPYLGIIFVPFAFAVGGFGWYKAQRNPSIGGSKLALACMGLSFLILAIQVFLWWLLYLIPELGA